jgi:Flp pilus assembly protein TadD
MVVPFMAAAIDLILRRRSVRQITLRFLFWIPLSILCAVVAKISQPTKFYINLVSPLLRPFIAGDAIAFYLWKIVWPLRLAIDYGRRPQAVAASHLEFLTCLPPLALLILLWIKRRQWKLPLAGAAVFIIALAPVLGLVPFDFQMYSTVADHYLYLPMLGISMIVASLIAARPRPAVFAASVIILALLATQTFLQARIWQTSASVFTHALDVNPRSWASRHNLSLTLFNEGNIAEAEKQTRIALQIKPDYGQAYVNLAHILQSKGDLPGAIDAASKATQIQPDDPDAWTWLGHILDALGRSNQAIDAYRKALQLDPNNPIPLINLGSALAEQGDLNEAISLYQAALKMNPASPEASEGFRRATQERDRRAATQR